MRTISVNIYTYGELSDKAKEAVKQWLNDDDSFMLEETLETDLSDHYEIPHAELSYSLGYCQGDGVSFTGSWQGEELKDIISKVYNGSVPSRLDKILPYFTLKFTRNSRHYSHKYTVNIELQCDRDYSNNMVKLIEEAEKAIDLWRISICKALEETGYAEIEYRNSEEVMEETCDANDYEFYEDGSIV